MNWDYFMVWMASKANLKKKGVRHHSMDECLNCQEKIDPEQFFCANCGQKVHHSTLTVWSLIVEFFAGIFNLENGTYKTLLYLPRPAYLSRQFMSGKRKKFLNPIRLFLIAMVIHIAVITNLIPLEKVNEAAAKNIQEIGQQTLLTNYQALKDSLGQPFLECDLDSLERIIFNKINKEPDTLNINTRSEKGQSFIKTPMLKEYRFAWTDMYDMDLDDFLTTYKAKTYWEKLCMTQLLRTVRDPTGAIRFYIGNLIWSIVSTIVILGFFMKLLYIRRKRYYVEHLIVLFNIHSFSFLLMSLAFYIGFTLEGPDNDIDDFGFLVATLYFFLSIKYYYKQGWIKSFIKFAILGLTYLFLLVLMIALVTIISMFFFK